MGLCSLVALWRSRNAGGEFVLDLWVVLPYLIFIGVSFSGRFSEKDLSVNIISVVLFILTVLFYAHTMDGLGFLFGPLWLIIGSPILLFISSSMIKIFKKIRSPGEKRSSK
jgi:hypothetical protein